MATFVERMVGAARLDPAVFEEVEGDAGATGQAAGVVALASLAAGIGAAAGLGGLVGGTVAGILGWYVWAWLTWLVGTKWLPEPGTRAGVGELLRTIGFASAPGILRVFGFLPLVGALVHLVVFVWMLVAVVVAVRQALDFTSTGRAVAVCVIGWLVQIVLFAAVMGLARAAG